MTDITPGESDPYREGIYAEIEHLDAIEQAEGARVAEAKRIASAGDLKPSEEGALGEKESSNSQALDEDFNKTSPGAVDEKQSSSQVSDIEETLRKLRAEAGETGNQPVNNSIDSEISSSK